MMIRKKLAVLMLAGVTCLASGCGNVVKDGTEALGEGRYDAAETAFEEATKNENKEVAADGYQGLGMTYYEHPGSSGRSGPPYWPAPAPPRP